MLPSDFELSNGKLLGGFKGIDDETVVDLPVFRNDEQIVSCWKMTWRERLSALVHGRVWLQVMSTGSQPPIAITAAKTILNEDP